MAIHGSLENLLKESLPEYIEAARYCIRYKKDTEWGENQFRGCLGYPGTALLFTIADSIGSYLKKKPDFTVQIEGVPYSINNTSQHLYVFNSDYYRLALDKRTIEKLYDNYRGPLIHNTALPIEHFLFKDRESDEPFIIVNEKIQINVSAFLLVSETAVSKFIPDIDKVIPDSRQRQDILSKK